MEYSKYKRKLDALKTAEDQGLVADSMEYRKSLIEKLHAGIITLDELQSELKKTKRNAKKNGLKTRNMIYREG